MTTVLTIARDVVREAFASRYMMVLFALIAVALMVLSFSLNLEVVDGALAATRLFGQKQQVAIGSVDVLLRPVFRAIAWMVFYLGLLFGVVVTADIAPRVFAPGRVEFTLALPVRRLELVLGVYLGVGVVCASATLFAVGGTSLVFFVKAGFATAAPAVGALLAVVGFLPLYAAMLLAGVITRSPAASAGSGISLYLLGIVVADKREILSWMDKGIVRSAVDVLLTPIPNLRGLGDVAGNFAGSEPVTLGLALPIVGVALAFAAFCVVLAAAVVQTRDY